MTGATCPSTADAWIFEIEAASKALGLPKRHALSDAVIDAFLPAHDRPTRQELAAAVPANARGPVTRFWLTYRDGP